MPYRHQAGEGGITSAVKKKASEDKANLEKESTMLQGVSVGSPERLAELDSSAFVEDNSIQHPIPAKYRDNISAEEDAVPVR